MKTKEELPACPVATAVSLIGGKWKLLILRNLKTRPWRFNMIFYKQFDLSLANLPKGIPFSPAFALNTLTF